MNFAEAGFVVGFVGDLALQIIVDIRGNIANLKPYFQRHGPIESLFIAGGVMFFVSWIYEWIPYVQKNYWQVFLYGGIWDILWRKCHLFITFDDTYYTANNQLESFIWGGIPMVLILFLHRLS